MKASGKQEQTDASTKDDAAADGEEEDVANADEEVKSIEPEKEKDAMSAE